MVNRIVTGWIIFTILLSSSFSVSVAKAELPVVIVSHSGYVAITGSYYVVGEVQNVGSEPLEYVKLTATYYAANGSMVGTDYTYNELTVLNPGCKSPFKIIYMETARVPYIDHYSLEVSYFSSATTLPEKLQILSSNSYVSESGYLHVIGEIQNLGSTTATYVMIAATFYDQTGKVVTEDYTYSDPSDIQSGHKAPFDLILLETNRIPLISSFSLTAESTEYSLSSGPEPNTTIAYCCSLFGARSFRVIYPSDLSNPKALGCGAASVSDWLSSMAVSTKLSNFSEGLDTEVAFVNQVSGKPVGFAQTGIVSFGGPFVNPVMKYAESDSTPLADQAPIRFKNEGTSFSFQYKNGTTVTGSSLPISVINQGQDMFVIETYRDGDGRNIMLCYGFGWKGTYAAGKCFDQIIYPNLYAFDVSWVIVKWDDTNGNGFVNNPEDGDNYTLIASG